MFYYSMDGMKVQGGVFGWGCWRGRIRGGGMRGIALGGSKGKEKIDKNENV